MLCSGFGWILEQLPALHGSGGQCVGGFLQLQGGNKDGGAVYSQDAACCCSDCGQGYGCGEDRALCIVTTTTTTTTTTILGLQQCAQEDVTSSIAPWNLFPLCSASRSVRGSCNVLIYSPLISMFIVNCLCTNLASNKSVNIKISFHFTQAMLQLLYQC